MWSTIKSNWSFMRIVRLLAGIAALWQAIVMKDNLLGAAGVLLMIMSVMNIGCCGVNSCSAGQTKLKSNEIPKEISYETVDAEK